MQRGSRSSGMRPTWQHRHCGHGFGRPMLHIRFCWFGAETSSHSSRIGFSGRMDFSLDAFSLFVLLAQQLLHFFKGIAVNDGRMTVLDIVLPRSPDCAFARTGSRSYRISGRACLQYTSRWSADIGCLSPAISRRHSASECLLPSVAPRSIWSCFLWRYASKAQRTAAASSGRISRFFLSLIRYP